MKRATSHPVALSFRDVRKDFGRSVALDGVSFDVPAGSIFALVGPNGAGKTTLLSCVANFIFSTSGTITMFGRDITRDAYAMAGRFSMLPQDAAIPPEARVEDLLVMWSRLGGTGLREARVESQRVLDLVGLASRGRQKAGELSHGMLKRFAIAQAFLGSPELIILDEPTSGLDPENAAGIRELLREMVGERTALVSSHNLLELQSICTDCAILDKGSVLAAGSMTEIRGGHELIRMHLNAPCGPAVIEELKTLSGVHDAVSVGQAELRLTLQGPTASERDQAIAHVLRRLDRHDLVPRSMQQGVPLEERFLELVGGRSDALGGR